MKAKSRPEASPKRESVEEEARLFAGLFRTPDRLRERLLLAIALSPPKAKRSSRPGPLARRRRGR